MCHEQWALTVIKRLRFFVLIYSNREGANGSHRINDHLRVSTIKTAHRRPLNNNTANNNINTTVATIKGFYSDFNKTWSIELTLKSTGTQTFTSIRQRGWSGWMASLPLSFFLFLWFFFAKATGRTVRQICTNEGSKRVVPRKEVPFEDLNDVPWIFGLKPPKKLKFFGTWIGLSSLNDKKSNS